jgi:hypothetical protein
MTALKKYQRIEAVGLWRASPDDQRREVVVSIGNATLVISDMADRAVAHWSLAAVERANPGKRPALFHPDGDPGETLELAASEKDMIDAIETLRRAVDRARPKPGRLRWLGAVLSICAVMALAVFWLPNAVISHTVAIVPASKRADIGQDLQVQIERLTGPACVTPAARRSLALLGTRLGIGSLTIVPSGPAHALGLPGGRVLLNRALVEDHEDPAVVAGYAIVERLRARAADPLRALLDHAGLRASFRLLTTGEITQDALAEYAAHLVSAQQIDPGMDVMLAGFAAAEVSSTPYAYARDITGETVLPLIEADPLAGKTPAPLLSDADWLRLQGICGG